MKKQQVFINVIVENRCFGVFGFAESERLTWFNATQKCQEKFPTLNSNLATILNSQEQSKQVYHKLINIQFKDDSTVYLRA